MVFESTKGKICTNPASRESRPKISEEEEEDGVTLYEEIINLPPNPEGLAARPPGKKRGDFVSNREIPKTAICLNWGCGENHRTMECKKRYRQCIGCGQMSHVWEQCESDCRICGTLGHSAARCHDIALGEAYKTNPGTELWRHGPNGEFWFWIKKRRDQQQRKVSSDIGIRKSDVSQKHRTGKPQPQQYGVRAYRGGGLMNPLKGGERTTFIGQRGMRQESEGETWRRKDEQQRIDEQTSDPIESANQRRIHLNQIREKREKKKKSAEQKDLQPEQSTSSNRFSVLVDENSVAKALKKLKEEPHVWADEDTEGVDTSLDPLFE